MVGTTGFVSYKSYKNCEGWDVYTGFVGSKKCNGLEPAGSNGFYYVGSAGFYYLGSVGC